MWTTNEGLEKWSAPHPWVAKVKHIDICPGGSYESMFTDGKQDNRNHGAYTEVVQVRRLAREIRNLEKSMGMSSKPDCALGNHFCKTLFLMKSCSSSVL
jgi:uncharacterized protein YndB with AHSA1/START domain